MFRHMEFRDLIIQLVRLHQPKTYVEVGVQKGYTFNTIAPMVKRAIAVDVKIQKSIITRDGIEHYEMPSSEFMKQWKDPIDLLFIDGDHRKETVIADFDGLSTFVPTTGLILLHDTGPVCEKLLDDSYCSNAWEAAQEISQNKEKYGQFEICTLNFPWAGLSIIRKIGKHYLYWR